MPQFEERTADWLSWEEAVRVALDTSPPLESRLRPLLESHGLALGEELVAPRTLPPGPTSAMDGYAVPGREPDEEPSSALLTVTGTSRPGDPPGAPVGSGEAARIMTGGLLPPGTDAVIPVERTEGEDGGAVRVTARPERGAFVRPAGEEMETGDLLASRADTLTPGMIALLASAGIDRVDVVPAPKVALIVTGDELINLEEGRRGGPTDRNLRIDVMSPVFPELIREAGGIPLDPIRAVDSRDSLHAAFAEASSHADFILTTGGASMGEADLVKRTLDELHFQLRFWRARIRPGSPVGMGLLSVAERPRGIPVMSLPGNPVSAFVTWHILARPAVRRMGGHRRLHLPRIRAILDEPLVGAEHLTHFFRVRLEPKGGGVWGVRSSAPQGSGVIRSLALSDGLAILPAGKGELPVGAQVEVLLLGNAGWPENQGTPGSLRPG